MKAALPQLVVDAAEATALAGLVWTVPLMAMFRFEPQMSHSSSLRARDRMKIA